MTRKQLAKKLEIPHYHLVDKYWDMVEVDKLLDLISKIEKKIPKSFIAGDFSDDLIDIAIAENENRVKKIETFIPAFEDNVVCHFFWIKDSQFPIPKNNVKKQKL